MIDPDVRTAARTYAQAQGEKFPDPGMTELEIETFAAGAMWGAALATPTRRKAILATQDALGCDIDGLEGFMPGCQEHEADITEEGLCPNATAAADAVLALVGKLPGARD